MAICLPDTRHPDVRRKPGQILLYAQALAGTRSSGAQAAFGRAVECGNDAEARCLYAEWLLTQPDAADRERGHRLFASILDDARYWSRHARGHNALWLGRSKARMKELERAERALSAALKGLAPYPIIVAVQVWTVARFSPAHRGCACGTSFGAVGERAVAACRPRGQVVAGWFDAAWRDGGAAMAVIIAGLAIGVAAVLVQSAAVGAGCHRCRKRNNCECDQHARCAGAEIHALPLSGVCALAGRLAWAGPPANPCGRGPVEHGSTLRVSGRPP